MEPTLASGPFLVLSDLHIGHPASLVQDVGQLAGLFQPGTTVIFNGDTFEMRRPSDRERAVRHRAELDRMLLDLKIPAIFITGNHDPLVSDIHHLEFPEEGILITHGDFLFHKIAPWSLNAPLYARAHASEIRRLPGHLQDDLEARLQALRRAAQVYDIEHHEAPSGLVGTMVHLVETAWPPWRPLLIIKCWLEIPALARQVAAKYRPDSRFMLIGHSHYAGIWEQGGLNVINTGALMRGFTKRAVRLEASGLAVFDIGQSGRQFVLGGEKFRCSFGKITRRAELGSAIQR